jgi:hypothetical protein
MALCTLQLVVCILVFSSPHANDFVLYTAEHVVLNTTIDVKQTGCLNGVYRGTDPLVCMRVLQYAVFQMMRL